MIPTTTRTPTQQPVLTAVELSLKDGLRSLGVHLHLGAHWLVDDLAPRLAQQAGPLGTSGKFEKLHGLIDSAARQTLQKLESAQHRASATVLDDGPYRTLEFQLLPLAHYLASGDSRNPSGLFAEVFYWLIRHALAQQPDTSSHWQVHQRSVDSAYWQLHDIWRAQAGAGGAAPRQTAKDHARLCSHLLQVLLSIQPVHDATVPPWIVQAQDAAAPPQLLRALLVVVLAVGSVTPGQPGHANAADCLRLATDITLARLACFANALQHPAASEALATEFAFVFRHIDPC